MNSLARCSMAWLALLSSGVLSATPAADERRNDLRLVVQITVDMLCGDMPWRFKDRFGPGGFRYLMEQGTVYRNAHYQHSTAFPAVGHATLATGANAAQHGLAGNDWYDVDSGKRIYCVEDERHPIIGHKTEPHSDTSPRNLTSSTVGDELAMASGSRSRVFSVSIMAFTRTDLLAGRLTDTKFTRKVQNAFHPLRSGNVLVVQEPFWYLYPNADQFAAMHGSPYAYDTYVPIMFAGPGIRAQVVDRPVQPADIASTLTTYLGIKPPSGAQGEPLVEVLGVSNSDLLSQFGALGKGG